MVHPRISNDNLLGLQMIYSDDCMMHKQRLPICLCLMRQLHLKMPESENFASRQARPVATNGYRSTESNSFSVTEPRRKATSRERAANWTQDDSETSHIEHVDGVR